MKTENLLAVILVVSIVTVLFMNRDLISKVLFGNASAMPNELKGFR